MEGNGNLDHGKMKIAIALRCLAPVAGLKGRVRMRAVGLGVRVRVREGEGDGHGEEKIT